MHFAILTLHNLLYIPTFFTAKNCNKSVKTNPGVYINCIHNPLVVTMYLKIKNVYINKRSPRLKLSRLNDPLNEVRNDLNNRLY